MHTNFFFFNTRIRFITRLVQWLMMQTCNVRHVNVVDPTKVFTRLLEFSFRGCSCILQLYICTFVLEMVPIIQGKLLLSNWSFKKEDLKKIVI